MGGVLSAFAVSRQKCTQTQADAAARLPLFAHRRLAAPPSPRWVTLPPSRDDFPSPFGAAFVAQRKFKLRT
ncbi:MAG TPA: hypothetical protein VGK58_16365, partial [Lacipirellulaceae bacterium]